LRNKLYITLFAITIRPLASCLIYAWALPAHPYSTQLPILGKFFYWTRFISQQCTVRQSLRFIWSVFSRN